MGIRVSPPVSDGAEDNAIAGRVLAWDTSLSYTRKELVDLAQKDSRYQAICRKKLKKIANQPPIKKDIEEAEQEAKRAFLHWQRLKNFLGQKELELERIESEKLQRMRFLGQREAAKSIRRIQAVLGQRHLKTNRVPVFPSKRSGPRVSRVEAIAATLREPLECPKQESISESPVTPS